MLWHGRGQKHRQHLEKNLPPRAVPLVATGRTSSPQLLLLAGVVVWRAVVFVRRLSRPALASFPRLGHSDCASVGSAFPGVAAHLWNNGGGLGRWGEKRGEKFGGTPSIHPWFLEFAVKLAASPCHLVQSVDPGRSLHVTLQALGELSDRLTAARYGAELPAFGGTGGEAPGPRISVGVPAEVLLQVLLWEAGGNKSKGAVATAECEPIGWPGLRGAPVHSRCGVVAVVVWLLGVPALAGEAAVGGGGPSSVVLATADDAVLCGGATTSRHHAGVRPRLWSRLVAL